MTKPLVILMVVLAAAFAFWPVSPRTITAPKLEQPEPSQRALAALDTSAFRTPIWLAEPPPPAPATPAPPPPPPPPLKIQLLAILHEDGVYKAAVYDPDTDRILVVKAGEKIGVRTAASITATTLVVKDEAGSKTLALKEGTPP